MFNWLKRRKSPLMKFTEQAEGLQDPCPACGCWSLRRYTAADGTTKTVCLNGRCTDPAWKPDDCPAWQ